MFESVLLSADSKLVYPLFSLFIFCLRYAPDNFKLMYVLCKKNEL